MVTVGDGNAAVETMKQQEFDVILSDIQMPGVSGVELLRLVREHDLDVPVVLMTADPKVETAAEAVELGALQYLVKPIPVETLMKSMERAAKLHMMARMKRESLKLLGQLDRAAGDRAGLVASFDRMLDTMWMAFQPIVSSDSRTTFGYEALLRSERADAPAPGRGPRGRRAPRSPRRARAPHPRQGRRGRRDARRRRAPLRQPPHAGPRRSDAALGRRPAREVSPSRVVLEITERAALDDIKDVKARVAALRAVGYRIAVDDLGAGYAGLTSFALLEPEFVKLDMSLVRGVHTSALRQKLIGSMSTLCHDMGMKVVAEGIEETEERDALVSLDVSDFAGLSLRPTCAPLRSRRVGSIARNETAQRLCTPGHRRFIGALEPTVPVVRPCRSAPAVPIEA